MIADIIIISVIVFFLVMGAVRGLAKTLLSIGAVILALFVSGIVSQSLAISIYDYFIRDNVIYNIDLAIVETGIDSVISNVISMLPAWANVIVSIFNTIFGLDTGESLEFFSGMLPTDTMNGTNISDYILQPLVTKIIGFLLLIFLFIVFYIVARELAKIAEKAFEIPVIKQINALLGGVVGAIEGILVMFVVVNLFCFIISMIEPDILSNNYIEGLFLPLLHLEFRF